MNPGAHNCGVVHVANELESLIRAAAASETSWKEQKRIVGNAQPATRDYSRAILISVLSRCEKLGEAQIALIKDYFGAGPSLTESGYRAWIPSEQNGASEAVSNVPKFFKLLATHDLNHGTRLASDAIHLLRHLTQNVILAGQDGSSEASKQADAIHSVLTRYMDARKVQLSNRDSGTAASFTQTANVVYTTRRGQRTSPMICPTCERDVSVNTDRCPYCRSPLTDQFSAPRPHTPTHQHNNPNESEDASIISPLVIVIGLVEKTDWQTTFLNDQARNMDVVNYAKLLFCFLIASDNRLSEEEALLFNSFWQRLGGSELSAEEIHHMVASSQDEAFKTLGEPPKFFRHLVAHDLRHKTNYADGALQALQLFVQVIVGIDGEITDEEAQSAASVLARLSVYAQSMGLASATPDKPVEPAPAEQKKPEQSNGHSSDSLADLLKQMDALVGLAQVKEEVGGLVNLIKVRKLRQDRGIKCPPLSLHLVFSGNPGTGKTTVARLLGGIFKALGILSSGHLVEVDRSGLVAGYVGQTAIKVKEVTEKSLGGILFIDEAYSLASKSEQDYGREAVETMLKMMEDHRDNLVVIAAGYTEKMEEFLNINPGLRSRFNKFIQFQDYSPDDLLKIFSKMCGDNGYEYSSAFLDKIREILAVEFELRNKDFANARTARNIFERVVANHSNRLARQSNPSDQELVTFEADDIGALSKQTR